MEAGTKYSDSNTLSPCKRLDKLRTSTKKPVATMPTAKEAPRVSGLATVDDRNPGMTLRTLNYGNYMVYSLLWGMLTSL